MLIKNYPATHGAGSLKPYPCCCHDHKKPVSGTANGRHSGWWDSTGHDRMGKDSKDNGQRTTDRDRDRDRATDLIKLTLAAFWISYANCEDIDAAGSAGSQLVGVFVCVCVCVSVSGRLFPYFPFFVDVLLAWRLCFCFVAKNQKPKTKN